MTEDQWRNVDGAFVAKMDALDPHELVRLLWDGDDDAWRYVNARAVVPMLKRPALGGVARDRQRSDLDICAAVYEYLIGRRKLEQYKFKCPVVYWIRFWVLKDILGHFRKKNEFVSDEVVQIVLQDKAAPCDNRVGKEEAAWCFRKLWNQDRSKARVLYLKDVEGRSAKEIMSIMNISSEANVNQMHSRACALMREFRAKSQLPSAASVKGSCK